ncbi:MAG: FAD-dependent oxidoreductase [Burkholderiales bacterium]
MDVNSRSEAYDVAIVGGGVSGIYTGYRLLTGDINQSPLLKAWAGKNTRLKVAVFEGSDRIGGRLLSARPLGMPHVTCEMGGMRYVSSQPLIRNLIENILKLARHEQIVDDPRNIAYLRGKHLKVAQLQDPNVLPYSLEKDEQAWMKAGNTASTLMGWSIGKLLPETNSLHGDKLRAYLQSATIDGTPLYQHGFWNLLARSMSFEAYSLARATVGYDCLGANANALDLTMEYFDFTPDVKYYLLDAGYEAVPWSLETRFTDAGGEVVRSAWLDGFEASSLEDGTRGVRLHFHDGSFVNARAIVLAMPKRSLELLRRDGPVLGSGAPPRVNWLMGSVEGFPFDKLFMVYDKPWWESAGVSQGRSLTDAPIRQCYYWAVEGKQSGADPANTNAAIMAYNDVSNAEFWGGLRGLPLGPHDAAQLDFALGHKNQARSDLRPDAFQRKTIRFAGNADDINEFAWRQRRNWDERRAPRQMVAEMHRQLMLLHNLRDVPDPLDAAFMDWTDDPFGGGVHLWNPGYKSWEVCEEMTQPVSDFPCYICGEAYSTTQTWVEGALETAEYVLQKRFQLGAPS